MIMQIQCNLILLGQIKKVFVVLVTLAKIALNLKLHPQLKSKAREKDCTPLSVQFMDPSSRALPMSE